MELLPLSCMGICRSRKIMKHSECSTGKNRRDSLPSIFSVSRRPRYLSPDRLGWILDSADSLDGPPSHSAPHMPRTLVEIPLRISHGRRSVVSGHVLCFLSPRQRPPNQKRQAVSSALSRRTGIFPGAWWLHVTGLAKALFRVFGCTRRRAGWKGSEVRNSRNPR